ncbi:MAG TPA: C40 family peptidase [Vicinamibacterales bacterium]|jgi:cell wall-associated NlpC family hydrolase|nr:C40 family peptidase [Vicinamibacterales bacterium]
MTARLDLLARCAITLLMMMAAACASSNAVPRPFPGAPIASAPHRPTEPKPAEPPATAAVPQPAAPSGAEAGAAPAPPSLTSHRYNGRAVADYALAFRGVPYRFGGADPAGFDCSGFVRYVFAQYGISLPRIVEEQWQVGDKIKPSEIEPGDLLFFSTKGPGATHVAISLDSEHFVHAPNSAGVVRVETLSSSYWGSHYVGARRIKASASSN